MQTYAEAKFTAQEGRALWLAMLRDVKRQRLMAASSHLRVIARAI